MNPDDLIDDVARRMTSADETQASVLPRVRAGMAARRQSALRPWRLVQAGLMLVVGAMVVSLLVPTEVERGPDDGRAEGVRADIRLRHAVASAGQESSAPAARGPIARADVISAPATATAEAGPARLRRSAASARQARATPATASRVEVVSGAGTGMLALTPLARPDPIVIEPVPMHRLEIVPLAVEAIELTAIAIPAIDPPAAGGV